MAGTLYVVATPLGNLEDLSPRAAATLTRAGAAAGAGTHRRRGRAVRVGTGRRSLPVPGLRPAQGRRAAAPARARRAERVDRGAVRGTAARGGAARGPRGGVWPGATRGGGARADQAVRRDPRRDPGRAGGLLRRSARPRRGDGDGGGHRQAHPGGARHCPRPREACPRALGAGDDASRRGRAARGGDGDYEKHGVSARQRTMNRWTVALCLVWLPLAGGLPGCEMRDARCVNAGPHLASPIPHPASRRIGTSLTIGRLHYDGGGDWYAGPSALPNLLAALRQRTALSVTERERVVTLTGPELWDVPYLFMTGHGNVRFSDEEVKQLRR